MTDAADGGFDEDDAIDALGELGLSTYEAKVFIGLQQLGSGSARDVAEVTDVPRSQVYGAAESLAEYGIVDIQQGTPTRFRPVDVEEARERLTERLESTAETAFEYVEAVRGRYDEQEASSEAIWTVSGADNVSARVATLVEDAAGRVVYGASAPSKLDPSVGEALSAAAQRGVTVVVISVDPAVGERVDQLDAGVQFAHIPEDQQPEESAGRLLVCDSDTVLISVSPTEALPEVSSETAFWSTEGAFATVLVTLVEERHAGLFGRRL